ncbi:MAG TPA: hypothetical protein DHN29_12800 [Cytophagales bacterium]|nr:hypothetical protein [Cytophagales bacterium]
MKRYLILHRLLLPPLNSREDTNTAPKLIYAQSSQFPQGFIHHFVSRYFVVGLCVPAGNDEANIG